MWNGDCLVLGAGSLFCFLKLLLSRAGVVLAILAGIVLGVVASVLFPFMPAKRTRFSANSTKWRTAVLVLLLTTVVAILSLLWSVPTAVADSPRTNGPTLALGAAILDLGRIEAGKPLTRAIWCDNQGDRILKIDNKKIRRSCSCINVKFSNNELQPGKKQVMQIYLRTTRQVGPFTHSLVIPYDDHKKPEILIVKGETIGPPFVVYPPQLYFARVHDVNSAHRSIACIVHDRNIKSLDVSAIKPEIQCTARSTAFGFLVDVSFRDIPKPGLFLDTLRLSSDDPPGEHIEIMIPLTAIIEPVSPTIYR